MLGVDQFENFIIKQITQHSIVFDSSTLSLIFNRVVATSKTMSIISEEGKRYGLTDAEILNRIEKAARKITLAPREESVFTSLQIATLHIGQHLKLLFLDGLTGMLEIELMVVNSGQFLLLSSDFGTLQLGDILTPCENRFNTQFHVNFEIYRGGKRFPNKKLLFRTPVLTEIKLFHPSPVFEVLDSEEDFRHKELSEEIKSEPIGSSDETTYFSAYPQKTSFNGKERVLFLAGQNEKGYNAPFIIKMDSANRASLKLNSIAVNISHSKMMSFLAEPATMLCCELNPGIKKGVPVRRIMQVCDGELSQGYNHKAGETVWIVKRKLQLKIMY